MKTNVGSLAEKLAKIDEAIAPLVEDGTISAVFVRSYDSFDKPARNWSVELTIKIGGSYEDN